jgi:pimeloyl-ACP methyl ester carboxylesterase
MPERILIFGGSGGGTEDRYAITVESEFVGQIRGSLLSTDVSCRLVVVDVPNVHYVRNGEVALAYQLFGNGPVELVYAPQWINNLEVAWSNPLYARFLNRLASLARVAFVDRRGMGLSDRLSATDAPPLETLMEDLRVVIDSAEFKRPVLFGGSDAGCICALFAATHPDRASALIVYGPEARGTATSDYPWVDDRGVGGVPRRHGLRLGNRRLRREHIRVDHALGQSRSGTAAVVADDAAAVGYA